MQNKLEKYAGLVIASGINIQKNQILVIVSPIESSTFTRMLARKAYELGAREVVIKWTDEQSEQLWYAMAHEAVFDEFAPWAKDFYTYYVDKGAAFVSIHATDPELLKAIHPNKISRQSKARNSALAHYRSKLMRDQNAWCVISIPTEAWANKVFPEDPNAQMRLWDAIFQAVRVDTENPVEAWKAHQSLLNVRLDFLNTQQFTQLKYTNRLGTKLTVELPEGHYWMGGGSKTPEGQAFIANMPTEEVFTVPKADGVHGIVYSSIPLNYNGNIIDQFFLEFKDGLVTNFGAKQGAEVLQEMLSSDDGAKRLGEVALVPYDSPISNQKILYYNTLFDENASCHFALGKAYPLIKDSENYSKDELTSRGVNDSLIHVDFMIGTDDLCIVGINKDGKELPLFERGNFVF